MKPAQPNIPEENKTATEEDTPRNAMKPTLNLAGLNGFLFDAITKRITWMEPASLEFGEARGFCEATLNDALRLLSPANQKQILTLIQQTIKYGKAGPIEFGFDETSHILSLSATLVDTGGGRRLVLAMNDGDGEASRGGEAVRGVAPVIRHLVEDSAKAILVVDSFGYIRYANENLYELFQVSDPSFCEGRNIAHIVNRVGKTLTTVVLTTLARRAPAQGSRKFSLCNNDAISLTYSVLPFRVSQGLGGAIFTAERTMEKGVDFAKVFDAMSAAVLLIDTKTRMIAAANSSARKAYSMSEQLREAAPITETLLHPRTYKTLLDQAVTENSSPVQATVYGFDGVPRSKRLRPSLIQIDELKFLLLEAKY